MKDDVMALVDLLSMSQATSPEAGRHYDDTAVDVAKMGLFNVVSLIGTAAGTAEYRLPASASRLMGVFYDDALLSRVTLRELESEYPEWRSVSGRPRAYMLEDLDDKVFRLFPTPDGSGEALVPNNGAPFGLDYPVGTAAAVHSELREDFPVWLDLPLAFLVLSREFARDSNHKDMTFAEACKNFGGLLMSMAVDVPV